MTRDFFNSLNVGDCVNGYKVIKIERNSGLICIERKTSNFCTFCKTHYSLFLIYNKKIKLYE